MVTDGDRFISQTVTAMLPAGRDDCSTRPGRCAARRRVSHAYFAALTSQRLILISSKRKFRGLLLENQGVEEVPRAMIANVTENAYELTFTLTSGGQFLLVVPKSEKDFSNQRTFVRDVPRMLAAVKATGPAMQVLG